MSWPSCSEQSLNPAGTTTGVKVGLAAAVVVTAGVGSAAGVRVARFTTAITDATAMTSATIATVARPRRSHLPEILGGGGSALAATGSALAATGSLAARGGEGGYACVVSCGRGASLVDRLSAVS